MLNSDIITIAKVQKEKNYMAKYTELAEDIIKHVGGKKMSIA